jgi:hypothetical protein
MPKVDFSGLLDLNQAAESQKFEELYVNDFTGRGDRTLTFGYHEMYYEMQTFLHIYMQNNELHLHQYYEYAGVVYTVQQVTSKSLPIHDLQPIGLSVPAATDYEFALLLLKRYHPLTFESFNANKSAIDGPYFGWRHKFGQDIFPEVFQVDFKAA